MKKLLYLQSLQLKHTLMKRILFTLLFLLGVRCMMAYVIVCTAEGELPQLLEREAPHYNSLYISGPLSAEDVKAINKYTHLQALYLGGAQLSTIPENAWVDLKGLGFVELPIDIDTLNLNAFSYQTDLRIGLPGNFPYLQNHPKDGEVIPIGMFPEFIVDPENTRLSLFDYLEDSNIISADGKILYKSADAYCWGDFETVMPYAYADIYDAGYVEIYFGRCLKRIANNAFAGFHYYGGLAYWESHYKSGFEIHFTGETPPEKFGLGNLNIGYWYPEGYDFYQMMIVVPNKENYINADSSWGDLWIISESDWANGNFGNGIENTNIEKQASYYDLMGRPVNHPTRGIYIKDGKKVVIK